MRLSLISSLEYMENDVDNSVKDFGSVSLRCWPEVHLSSVVVLDGNDIKRSSPLSSTVSIRQSTY